MADDKTKILAMTEALILWDYLTETGAIDKSDAVYHLYAAKKLSRPHYRCNCPLCYYLRDMFYGCENCLWPKGVGSSETHYCERSGSPYTLWLHASSVKESKAAAKKVLDLLLSIEF